MTAARKAPGAEIDTGGARRVALAGASLVFGLEWHPVARSADAGPELRQAREAGYRFAARLSDGSLIGLARALEGWRPAHSAVALLIARHAEHGAEACLIATGDGADARVAFVGLMERRPVPGFDRVLPDLAQAKAMLAEFRALHPAQRVRVACHLPGHERGGERLGEPLPLETVFGQPDRDTRLRALPGGRGPVAGWAAAGVLALCLAGGFAGWRWREQALERAAAEQARLATAAAAARAERQRRDQVQRALAAAGRPGGATLARWRAAIAELPLVRAGWTLQQVECGRVDGCVATWTRHHGNFAQLQASPPGALAPAVMAPGGVAGANWLETAMQTQMAGTAEIRPPDRHPPGPDASKASPPDAGPADAGTAALDATRLPPLRDAVNVWGSRLQDLALAGGGLATLKAAVPLAPGAAGPDVHRLEWRLRDGVWSLPLVEVPPFAVAETLSLTLGASQVTYELSGSLYALGQRY